MAKHTSPASSPIHSVLREEVEDAGFDQEILRGLLWLINAHDRLIAFPYICGNILKILSDCQATWGFSVKDFCLHEDTIKLLKWVVENASNLENVLGADFNPHPPPNPDQGQQKKQPNPIVGKGATRHPLYAALCDISEARELRSKYRLLQGHFLYAQTKVIFAGDDRDGYENYDAQAQWKGIPNSPGLAGIAVRELSQIRYADVLTLLPVEQRPDVFAQSLNSLPVVENADFQHYLEAFRNFLQKSAGIRNWVKKDGAGGGGGGRGKSIHGFVDMSEQLSLSDIPVGDTDDADDDWGKVNKYTSIVPDPYLRQKLLKDDLSPYEFDDEDLYLIGDDKTRYSGGVAATGPAQLRHIIMLNQMLPWNFQHLTITEVASALARCTEWVNDTFIKNPPANGKHHDKDIKRLEAICLMRVMLFTGRNIDDAHEMKVLPKDKAGEKASLCFIPDAKGGYEWRVMAIQPLYKTHQPVLDATDRKKTDFFALPDVAVTHMFVDLLVKNRADRDSETGRKETMKYRVFRSAVKTIHANLKTLLKDLDPTGRLTVSKLSLFLFNRILEASGGDICAASLITGDEHTLAGVRLFYSMIPVDRLQKIYFDATREVVSLILSATDKNDTPVPGTLVRTKDKFVGSRFCPTFDAVKNAVARIAAEIQAKEQNDNAIDAHNLYTLLTVWHFSFSTACRAIETPYMAMEEIDRVTGIGLLADKDDGTKYKARLVWVPPSVLSQMEHYQEHRAKMLSPIPGLSAKTVPPVFFLRRDSKDRLKAQIVRPSTMAPLTQKRLPYPANFHRRFMRTELLARGCSTEAIDAYMGHWYMGEEPWSTHSSFSFQQYRNEMETFLAPLMEEIGLTGQFAPVLPWYVELSTSIDQS